MPSNREKGNAAGTQLKKTIYALSPILRIRSNAFRAAWLLIVTWLVTGPLLHFSDVSQLAQCQPVYESMPGWSDDISGARSLADLPPAARHYVARIEELTGVPVSLISVGSERGQFVRAE